ncbi:MAG: ABC transporter permease, partial [Acidobacteriota bacterium]
MPSIPTGHFRLALRRLRAHPGTSFVAALTMALGLGLSATTYTLVDAMTSSRLPFERADELVGLSGQRLGDDQRRLAVSAHDFDVWRQRQTSFEDLAGFRTGTVNLSDGTGLPERFSGAWVTEGFLDLLRVAPVLGRGLVEADMETGAPRVAVIGHGVWQTRYGGEPAVVGREVVVNNRPATIVGVLPEGFHFPENEDVWLPLEAEPSAAADVSSEASPRSVLARLGPGRSLDEASAEMGVIARQLEQQYPATHGGLGVAVEAYLDRYSEQNNAGLTAVMFGAIALVLAIACFNVANLLIARASLRSRDFAVQAALGAPGRHMAAQILLESLLLAAAGAVGGLGLAHLAVGAFDRAIDGADVPYWIDFQLHTGVFAAAAVCTAAAALFAGLVPAIQASRSDVRGSLADGGRGSTSFRRGRFSRMMVVGQVAASTALCLGAGLALRGVLAAQSYEHGFEPANLLTARVSLPRDAYVDDAERAAFFEAVERRLSAEPEVVTATVASALPSESFIGSGTSRFERPGEEYGRPAQMPSTRVVTASPSYLKTLGTAVVSGRDFRPSDRDGAAAVALVNESFAAREWPTGDAVGRTLDLWMGDAAEAADPSAGQVRVVGVVPDLRFGGFGKAKDPSAVYLPTAQRPGASAWVVARTRGEPLELSQTLRRALL